MKFRYLRLLILFFSISTIILTTTSCNDDEGNGPDDPLPENTFKDSRDNELYKTVEIGNQTWMAENLRYITSDNSWYYDNDASKANAHGRLYTLSAAKSACPEGWHLPSDEEWKELEMELGMTEQVANKEGYRGVDEGDKIKAGGSSGLNVLMSGMRSFQGEFKSITISAEFWTSTTQFAGNTNWSREFHDISEDVCREGNQLSSGLSVRCVKDN
ncbi:MAG: FISUMP domain-containing protein [Bacteroidota bacterium]|nr:FISUMP domain-containing protein [Bacteroidota bacterium]